ncbi:Arm DNA-binding domain-containing protein [Vibrio tapetis]|uniref:Tyr recombinase domain-containing protein n=1 Tax=Vibrio tapetis subsp. tapetis TaxID=1671868 RepID=A0A2N8ZAZ3_9VIBR|nr:Arm DNA-binding domain-containing protein [Vibrio tapetis]SON49043.1 protein of unknown function [Vibrio tapetis subsp. tapetis]
MHVQTFNGNVAELLAQLSSDTLLVGRYCASDSPVVINVKKANVELLWIGRPKAFPLNVQWHYVLGVMPRMQDHDALLKEMARVELLSVRLEYSLERNWLPPKEVLKIVQPICSLDFSDTAVQTQLKKVFALASIEGYEKTVLKYKDTSSNSEGIKLEVRASGSASYYITYRLKDDQGKWSNESAKVVGNARTVSLLQAREEAHYLKAKFIEKNKVPPKTHTRENKAVRTFRQLHELHVRSERGSKLKPGTVADYDAVAFNYLGKQRDYNQYQKERQDHHHRAPRSTKGTFVGLGILDRDFDSLNYTEAKQLHADLKTAIDLNNQAVGKTSTGRQADKVFTYVRTLIDKGNLLMQERDPEWSMRNPITLFSKEKIWCNPGGNSVRKDKTLPDQCYPTLWRGLQELRSYRLDNTSGNTRNVHKDVRSYKLNSLFYEFLLYTGFRPEDAVRIEWSQISMKEGSITWKASQRQNIKNGAGINDEHFVLYLNQQSFQVIKALDTLYQSYRDEIAEPFERQVEKIKAEKAVDLNKIKTLQDERDEDIARLACERYLFCNAYLNNKMKPNPTLFIDRLEGLTDLRITAASFRAMFQQKAAEVGLKDYEIKRLVFHKMQVNKSDVQAGYNMTSASFLKRISQRVANKISALCRSEFEQETFMLLDSSMAKRIKNALDLETHNKSEVIELMNDEQYEAFAQAEKRTVEENAQMMLDDFLQLMQNPAVKSELERLNLYKHRHYKVN